ncbi:hypothetical protein LCM02_04860 [Lutimonas saemankumensis]|uniref:hypothetical protein n=1 Tax=Lutimonas saemankumensis TaxID=483016 RepID=UPI001CD68ED2|nr:hypothetical protein [Lutimonas saemankumensis]MCA0931772.1 hypothetical protein [Lutimonas saemankumensis]
MKLKKTKLSFLKQTAICLTFIALMTSCDDSDDMDSTYFSPPSWIIGTWESDIPDEEWNLYYLYRVFEFTSDNVIGKSSLEPNVSSMNFNQTINTSEWGLKGLDNIRNNEYEAILVFAGIHTSHRFEKVNDTTLIYHYLFNKDYPEDEESIIMHKVK